VLSVAPSASAFVAASTSCPPSTGSGGVTLPLLAASVGKNVLAPVSVYCEYCCHTAPDWTLNTVGVALRLPESASAK
jgi:hypothetical protein